jgi:hypothetical protein
MVGTKNKNENSVVNREMRVVWIIAKMSRERVWVDVRS